MRYRLTLLLLLLAPVLSAEQRPISAAERESVRIAADYLSRGPVAIVENLAASSPMRRLTPAEQLAEIETRLGPPAGAAWELETVMPSTANSNAVFAIEFPTGIDDAALFELKQEKGAYKINDIHVLAERSSRTQYFPKDTSDAPKKDDDAPNPLRALIMVAVAVALLAVTGALTMAWQPMIGRITIGGAMLLGVLVVGRTLLIEPKEPPLPPQPAKKAPSYPKLAALLPLRRAATGTGDVDAAFAAVPRMGDVYDVAQIWKAQIEIQQSKLPDAKARLKRFPSPSTIPLAELLRARLAQLEGDEASSALS